MEGLLLGVPSSSIPCREYSLGSCQQHIPGTDCHLQCFSSAVDRISVCSCSCGVFVINYTLVPTSHSTFPVSYLSPSPQSLPPVSREKWGIILFSWKDTWFMTCGFSCLGVAAQDRSKFGGSMGCVRKDNQESLGYFMCCSIFIKVIIVEMEAHGEL